MLRTLVSIVVIYVSGLNLLWAITCEDPWAKAKPQPPVQEAAAPLNPNPTSATGEPKASVPANASASPPPSAPPFNQQQFRQRFSLQALQLGMSVDSFKDSYPSAQLALKTQDNVIVEQSASWVKDQERYLAVFTAGGELYKIIYEKRLSTAVEPQDLLKKLQQRYGKVNKILWDSGQKKWFDACWGQCDLIRGGVFCETPEPLMLYSYLSASLDGTKTRLSIVIHDSVLLRQNERTLNKDKQIRKELPVKEELERLDL